MRIPPELSGSFAELRHTHFHGGLDYRTQQKEGIKVYSIAPGKIIKASVSKESYGFALYVQHPDSSISLYAHLSRFCPEIQRKVRRQQRKSRNYEVLLTDLDVKIRENRPIALSGNTGASGGPHLHHEIIRNGKKLNPCLVGQTIADSAAPKILLFSTYQQDTHSPTHFTGESFRIDGIQIDSLNWTGFYYDVENLPDTLFLKAPAAFGICALDSIHSMPFNYGLYKLLFAIYGHRNSPQSDHATLPSIESFERGKTPGGLYLGSTPLVKAADTLAFYQLDALPLETFPAIDRHIDTSFYKIYGKRIEKTWIDLLPHLSPYGVLQNRGFFYPEPGQHYTLFIRTEDLQGNMTELRIPMVGI